MDDRIEDAAWREMTGFDNISKIPWSTPTISKPLSGIAASSTIRMMSVGLSDFYLRCHAGKKKQSKSRY